MTQAEWRTGTYPMGMVRHLGQAASERKLNLLAAAGFRKIWHLLPGPKSRQTVEVLERYADGRALAEELAAARQQCWEDAALVDNPEGNQHPSEIAIAAVSMDTILDMLMTAAEATAWVKVGTPEAISEPEQREQCGLVREIFGNPFRPVTIDPAWLTPSVVALVHAVYDNRNLPSGTLENASLAILAGALEDAGCDNADILNHCRQPGVHVRGCWVVDLCHERPPLPKPVYFLVWGLGTLHCLTQQQPRPEPAPAS